MRSFRHLTKSQISEIIVCHHDGESQASLAARFGVDPSTISYHVNKYDRAYPEEGGLYAVLKMQVKKTCIRPSSRCTLCGEMFDQLLRIERDKLAQLTRLNEQLRRELRIAGVCVEY